MKFVCPQPAVWERDYQALRVHWQQAGKAGPARLEQMALLDTWFQEFSR